MVTCLPACPCVVEAVIGLYALRRGGARPYKRERLELNLNNNNNILISFPGLLPRLCPVRIRVCTPWSSIPPW